MVLTGSFILTTPYSIIILFVVYNMYNWYVHLCEMCLVELFSLIFFECVQIFDSMHEGPLPPPIAWCSWADLLCWKFTKISEIAYPGLIEVYYITILFRQIFDKEDRLWFLAITDSKLTYLMYKSWWCNLK